MYLKYIVENACSILNSLYKTHGNTEFIAAVDATSASAQPY